MLVRNRSLSLVGVALLSGVFALSIEHVLFSVNPVAAAEQGAQMTYKVEQIVPGSFGEVVETKLNEMARKGWEFHSVNGSDLIFKKRS